jgi:diadenosine tetraphosphate (Ap4A) HIT family hydrolase
VAKTLIHERVELARQGKNNTVICRVPSGWAVIGDVQFLRGYSLLLADPVVESLDSLSLDRRLEFLRDMALLGETVLQVTKATRMNYEILGNSEQALHAHVFPRYATEPEERRTWPAWFYDWKTAKQFDPMGDRELQEAIRMRLNERYRSLGLKVSD